MSDEAWSTLGREDLEDMHEPWAENYDKWFEELPSNVTDPSVPFLAAILSRDNSTQIMEFQNNGATTGIYEVCSHLNDYLDTGLSDSPTLDALYNRFGPELLVICMSYTNVTRTIRAGGLEKSAPELVEGFAGINLTGSDDSVALSKDTANNLATIMMDDCNNISCGRRKSEGEEEKGKTKMSPACEALFLNGSQDTIAFEPALECRHDLCNRARDLLKADPDIGGAGVFISYILQISISIFIGVYILVKLSHGLFKKRTRKFRPKHQHIRRSRSVVAHPAFERVLYLFTRVQAWFVVSLIISGTIRNYTHSISDVDEYLLITVALNGIAMLSFTLLAVHELLHRRSPTTLAISAIAFVAAAVFYVIFIKGRSNSFTLLLDTAWYCTAEELGTNGNVLTTLNFLSKINKIPAGVFWLVLVFCSIVEFVVILFECAPPLEDAWRRQNKWIKISAYALVGVMYIATLALVFFMLTSYFKVTDFQEWGFGQIMAVLFWVPVIYDYISERFLDPEESPLQSRVAEGGTVYLEPLKGEVSLDETVRERGTYSKDG